MTSWSGPPPLVLNPPWWKLPALRQSTHDTSNTFRLLQGGGGGHITDHPICAPSLPLPYSFSTYPLSGPWGVGTPPT
jgi:hypothetical protein